MKALRDFKIKDIEILDSLWSERIDTVIKRTIPACIQKCHETGRIQNFMVSGKKSGGEHRGHSYNDSDVYKVIEAIAYALLHGIDHELEGKADAIIDHIVSAQEGCGYLNTKYSTENGTSFKNFNEHEMYNCGHLIEAGIAYFEATGKDALLKAGIRFADYLMRLFGPGKRSWIPGHQEIELALSKLSETTRDRKYILFAKWLLDQRGERHDEIDIDRSIDREYCQDLENPSKLRVIYGHAVRAVYMLAAMARLTRFSAADYRESLDSVWRDITGKKMYVTGGIGSSSKNEGFSDDYFLPNEDAYCETCAAVGMVYYGYEMFLLSGDGRYMDVVERELYNCVLSGISREGDRFFYRNVLESNGDVSRQEWYDTACCPTQLARFIPTVGKYIFARKDDILFVNLFISSELKNFGTIKIDSDYPYSGRVKIDGTNLTGIRELRVRIPYWAKGTRIVGSRNLRQNGLIHGYLRFHALGEFSLELDFLTTVEIVQTNEMVLSNHGKAVIQYGPAIYCMERIDNDNFDTFALGDEHILFPSGLPEGLGEGKCVTAVNRDSGETEATFIPYFLWNNREISAMKVFCPIKAHGALYY